jgi:hypothetical protein
MPIIVYRFLYFVAGLLFYIGTLFHGAARIIDKKLIDAFHGLK